MKFEKALTSQLKGKPMPTVRERRLMAVLDDDTPGPLRKARLASMEMTARSQLSLSPNEPVDWASSSIDWKALLAAILPIILKLLGL